MSATLTIRDEELSSGTVHEFALEFPTETTTVRELIRSRVYQEVKDYNVRQNQQPYFQGLVQPTDAERTANGYRLSRSRQIDWKQQFELALDAFERKQILVLVNDRQAESLEEELAVGSDTVVTFLRLTMLVGG